MKTFRSSRLLNKSRFFTVPSARYIINSMDSMGDYNDSRPSLSSTSASDHRPYEESSPSHEFSGIVKKPKQLDIDYQPKVGELSKEEERFCAFQTVKCYPYTYIGNANRQRVDDGYFNKGKVYENAWELDLLERSQSPLLLVTTRQFIHFLAKINNNLGTKLTIPDGSKGAFEVRFTDGGTPRPRYLGSANSKAEFDELSSNIPSSNFKLEGEPETSLTITAENLKNFEGNLNLMLQSSKKKTKTKKNKDNADKIRRENRTAWNHTIKRVQRYLGIRASSYTKPDNIEITSLEQKKDYKPLAAFTERPDTMTLFNSETIAAFTQESSVIFISVDIEAWERDSRIITELGFATLDTRDILSVPPGERGINWRSYIRPRHFRIEEHRFYTNGDFVAGCGDRFEFGKSEFISIKDVSQVISDCFRHPFSGSGKEDVTSEEHQRKIVLVGHDIKSDIRFLKTVNFDVYGLQNLHEIVDSALMFRVLKRDMNTRSLGSILADVGIIGWNLHNAGNDAVYTLQAVIAIAIKHLEERQRQKETNINSDCLTKGAESTQITEGWSSTGNDSDGGLPHVTPPPTPKGNSNEYGTKHQGSKHSIGNVPKDSSSHKVKGNFGKNYSIRNIPEEW
ncbi:putative qde-2-interacting protein [Golovinomyces cichoracearum]|uniref:Putative qde-2-interacting protein n=1 Tax=Golovinomyces cichoracearum TaxID=62708 RepID=A0A420ILE6_9PEZI|nr:putative qde-2-interacting protein [Golovinomyces cichoracearum]